MRVRGCAWLLALLCLLCIGCGGNTASVTRAQQLLNTAAQMHDAAFTFTFTTDSAHGSGSGTLTTNPALVSLMLGANNQILIDPPDNLIYGRLTGDKLWSVLDDADNGIYTNYDMNVWEPKSIKSPQLIGSETLDGVAAWHVRGSFNAPLYDTTGNSVSAPGTADLWLRQSHAALTGTSETGIPFAVSLDATYLFTKWNQGTTITLPDPADIAASG
jgi:hypothetical protein